MFIILALANGLMAVLSRVVNAALSVRVGSLQASLVNHGVGAASAALLFLAGWGTGTFDAAGVPFVYWLGGCLGVLVVAASNYAVRHAGAALFAVLLLTFQVTASAGIDHFGLLGETQIPLTPVRLLGVLVLIAGAVLVVSDKATADPTTRSSKTPSVLATRADVQDESSDLTQP